MGAQPILFCRATWASLILIHSWRRLAVAPGFFFNYFNYLNYPVRSRLPAITNGFSAP